MIFLQNLAAKRKKELPMNRAQHSQEQTLITTQDRFSKPRQSLFERC